MAPGKLFFDKSGVRLYITPHEPVAQLVEQWPFKPLVESSNLSGLILLYCLPGTAISSSMARRIILVTKVSFSFSRAF
jgi:hypothetical protein